MVATNSARHASRNRNNHQVRIDTRERSHHNRNQNAEGSPRGSCRKSKTNSNQENKRRHKVHQARCTSRNKACHKVFCAKRIGNALQAPGKHQNDDCRDHRLKTFGQAFQALAQLQDSTAQIPNHSHDKGGKATENKAHRGVTSAKGINKALMRLSTGKESTCINQAQHAKENQRHNGEYQIQHCSTFIFHIHFLHFRTDHVCNGFALFHRSKIHLQKHQCKQGHNRQQRIEIKGNCLNEKPQTIFAFDKARHSRCP